MAQSFDHPQPQCVAQVVQGEALDTKTLGTHFLCDAADGLQAVSQPVTAADMRSAAHPMEMLMCLSNCTSTTGRVLAMNRLGPVSDM